MGELGGLTNRAEQLERFFQGEFVLAHVSSYRSAANVVHHAELVAVRRLAGIKDGDDVGVLERGYESDFTLETPPCGRRRNRPSRRTLIATLRLVDFWTAS